MNIEQRIAELEQISIEEEEDPYAEGDLDDVIEISEYNGQIKLAKEALEVIYELQKQKKALQLLLGRENGVIIIKNENE